MRIVSPSVELLAYTPNPEMLIERCGRTAYKSGRVKCDECAGEGKPCEKCGSEGYYEKTIESGDINEETAAKFVGMIVGRGHFSVIEHAGATLLITTDRGITHEIVRHRLVSYTQVSTRYCNYGKNKFGNEISVIAPPGMTSSQSFHWQKAMLTAECQYLIMLEAGADPQIARSVLPNSTMTEIAMSANLREHGHFLRLRMGGAAHPQIRQIALMAWTILKKLAPTCFVTDEFTELAHKIRNDEKIPGRPVALEENKHYEWVYDAEEK